MSRASLPNSKTTRSPEPGPPRVNVGGTWFRITRAGAHPLFLTPEPADGRWQRGDVVRAIYLADTADTAWAEWYRHTSELGVPPQNRLPRDVWRVAVDVEDVADLTPEGVLEAHGVSDLTPTRRQWRITQAIGESCFRAGASGILAPSAARRGGRVLAVFRPSDDAPGGLTARRPPRHYTELPALPEGLRT